jgi:hypothetical protein
MSTTTATPNSPDFLAGQEFERQRITVILGHKMSALDPNFALTIINLGFDPVMARKTLDAAYLDAQRLQPNAPANQFVAAMKAMGNPNVSGIPSLDDGTKKLSDEAQNEYAKAYFAGNINPPNPNTDRGFL